MAFIKVLFYFNIHKVYLCQGGSMEVIQMIRIEIIHPSSTLGASSVTSNILPDWSRPVHRANIFPMIAVPNCLLQNVTNS